MVPCKHCQTSNSVDSSFCKRCGTALLEDDLREARSLLGRSVGVGFVRINEGKIDEATAIATKAIAEDPNLPEALSLMGMCHEHNLRLAEALECYERVLEINPESSLDKIKVSQIRNLLASKPAEPVQTGRDNKRLALYGAVAATVFVIAIGSLSAAMLNKKRDADKAGLVAANTAAQTMNAVATPSQAFPTLKAQGQAEAPATSIAQKANDDDVAPVRGAEKQGPAPAPMGNTGNNRLPDVDPSTATTPIGPKPLTVDLSNGDIGPRPMSVKAPNKGVDPDPTASDPGPTAAAQQQAPAFDSSVIEINVSNPKHVVGGAEVVQDTNKLQAIAHTASSQFQLRHFDAAAKSYEKLLKAGADSAGVNQRLAQCYENLGRKGDAQSAYERAINSLEANIKAGKGNQSRQRNALDVCRQALKVLQES